MLVQLDDNNREAKLVLCAGLLLDKLQEAEQNHPQ